MLVLTRKVGEKIIIDTGDQKIVVMVCEIRRDKVRFGIDADAATKIDREEIYQSKLENRKDR